MSICVFDFRKKHRKSYDVAQLHRGAYTSANELLNSLNELRKIDKMQGCV